MKIQIPLSKIKTLIQAVGCSAITTISLWTWINSNTNVNDGTELVYLKNTSIVLTLLFGYSSIFLIRKLFNKKIGLVIDNNGFQYGSGLISNEYIPWINVSRVERLRLITKKYILVFVTNIDEIIGKQSGWKQSVMRSYIRTYGTPVLISSENLKINANELYKIMSETFSQSKNNHD